MAWFSRLYGNESTVARLSSLIKTDTLPHAFLIVGDEGSGRHTLVLQIAAALNCERRGEGNRDLPCQTCVTCRRILSGQFTDVKTLGKSGGKATIGVDEVRVFREDVYLSATESKYKIYVIENAEALTPQAQNALLKVIEEPPQGVIFFLIATAQDKILTTIKSRVQTVLTERHSSEKLDSYLSNKSEFATLKQGNSKRYRELLLSSCGNIGRAVSLLKDDVMDEEEKVRADVSALIECMNGKRSYADLRAAVLSLPDKRAEFCEVVEKVLLALRDLSLIKRDGKVSLLFYLDKSQAEKVAAGFTQLRLQKLFDIFENALSDCQRNANMSLLSAEILAGIKSV